MTSERLLAAIAIVFAAGCFADDDQQCLQYGTGAGEAPIQAYELRDPTTGVCQPYGGGGGDCTDPCSPCALSGTGAAEVQPDWAQCFGACEGLDETTCKATTACRAAYAGGAFYQCWGVAPSGPIEGGTCSTFDAQTCSQHDDCVALHAAGSPIGAFTACAAEGSVQDPGSCVGTVTCTTQPPACPANTLAGRRNGCWTGYCIPYAQCDMLPACSSLAEMDCISRTDCSPVYEGQNCSCNGSSCTCQSWTFDSCKAM